MFRVSLFSVRHKLYLAFGCITLLTIVLGGVSWQAFNVSGRSLQSISQESIPALSATSNVSIESAKLSALAPQLLLVKGEGELDALYKTLLGILERQRRFVLEIQSYTNDMDAEKIHEVVQMSLRLEKMFASFKG